MEKEKYILAELEIIEFKTEDVITSSGSLPDEPTLEDDVDLPILL